MSMRSTRTWRSAVFMPFVFAATTATAVSSASAQGHVTSPKEFFGHNIGDDYFLPNYDQFIAYWRDVHAHLFSSQPVVKQYVRRYVQSRTIANPPKSVLLADFDGVAQVWFDDIDGFHGVFSSPNYRDVIRVDEHKFTDGTRTEFLFSEETSIIG